MTSPFWLVIFMFHPNGVAIEKIPMPTEEVCIAAADSLPAYTITSLRGYCIQGETK